MSLLRESNLAAMSAPVVVVAFDAWVDAGAASTTAAETLAADAPVVARLDGDLLFDYRARRPTLDIRHGRPRRLDWPELTLRQTQLGGRDVIVLSGPEPDFRWRELATEMVDFARRTGVAEWITLGSIPAAVPHTRPVPVLGTESKKGLLRAGVEPGPRGLLRVPAAAVSMLDLAVSAAGIPTVGYFTQVPHYVSGAYPPAALALLRALEQHLDVSFDLATLETEATLLRGRLDEASKLDENTHAYVTRLEAMVDEARLPTGEELIGEIERFLRERGREPGAGQIH